MSKTTEILALANRLHYGQVDKQGIPYIEHLRAVASAAGEAAGSSAWVVGMLHDSVEDGKITFKDLRHHVGQDELIAIGLVTRPDDVTYEEYVRRIASAQGPAGLIARAVKRADLKHNLGRMTPELLESHPHLANRYGEALAVLGEEQEEMVRG